MDINKKTSKENNCYSNHRNCQKRRKARCVKQTSVRIVLNYTYLSCFLAVSQDISPVLLWISSAGRLIHFFR